jgi:shikimate kinase
MRSEKLLLIGPMGAGKSTIGKILAQELNWPYFDNDTELSQLSGLSAEELGEMPVAELHVLEALVLQGNPLPPRPLHRRCCRIGNR